MTTELRDFWMRVAKDNIPVNAAPHIRKLARLAFYAGAAAAVHMVDKAAESCQGDPDAKLLVEQMERLRLETREFANENNRERLDAAGA